MGVWDHIILEGYCAYSWASKKKWKMYSYEKIGDVSKLKGKPTIRENDYYISKKNRPFWCRIKNKKRIPQFKCLLYYNSKGKEMKCPFFGFCEADEEDKEVMMKAWSKVNE